MLTLPRENNSHYLLKVYLFHRKIQRKIQRPSPGTWNIQRREETQLWEKRPRCFRNKNPPNPPGEKPRSARSAPADKGSGTEHSHLPLNSPNSPKAQLLPKSLQAKKNQPKVITRTSRKDKNNQGLPGRGFRVRLFTAPSPLPRPFFFF